MIQRSDIRHEWFPGDDERHAVLRSTLEVKVDRTFHVGDLSRNRLDTQELAKEEAETVILDKLYEEVRENVRHALYNYHHMTKIVTSVDSVREILSGLLRELST